MTSQPAIFLDRDGVIIENRLAYVRTWDDVRLLPGALTAMARLAELSFPIVIVTNQSVIGRNIITLAEAMSINESLLAMIRDAGGRVDALYMCPHQPAQTCQCRKPKPGMLLEAASDLNLDLAKSLIVGDAISDLMAGHNAGLSEYILVLSGRGQEQKRLAVPAMRRDLIELNSLADLPAYLKDRL